MSTACPQILCNVLLEGEKSALAFHIPHLCLELEFLFPGFMEDHPSLELLGVLASYLCGSFPHLLNFRLRH